MATHSSDGHFTYLIPDRQGTGTLAIDSQTQAVTRRQYKPFGEQRDQTGTWSAGQRGYVGGLVARCRSERDAARRADGPNEAGPPPAVTAAALWSNLHGIAQLWAWGSLQLALGAPPLDGDPDDSQRDRLIAAVLDAHLGPVTS